MGSIDWELVAGVWNQKVNGNYQIRSEQKTRGYMKRSDTKSCNLWVYASPFMILAPMWESLQCHGLVLVKPIHTLLYIWSTSSSWKQPIQSEFRLESLPVAANCNQGSWGRNALIAWGVPCVQFLQLHNLYAAWEPNKLLRIPGIEVQIGNDSKLVFRLTPRRNKSST